MSQVSWTLTDAESFLRQAKSALGPTATLKLLDKADNAVQDVMMADPGNARVFLLWGHVHLERGKLYKKNGNPDASEQITLAIDFYESAIKNGGLAEARSGLQECKALQ
mmetsp:Transcript_14867/g.16504  ORF Transcript_14867/g.16504 Transcript_14867/m.16504 type:complete len:109 (+) Transcript_14867:44-370(+)